MTGGEQAAMLPDGRLHLHQGPIDLLVTAEGPGRGEALKRAARRFDTVLSELVSELDLLTVPYDGARLSGAVARRMADAVAPLASDKFVTPMAAVAGAVADEILSVLRTADLVKATVNNGGDIAFFLTKGQVFRAASPSGPIEVLAGHDARGLATSGWRGRSQSMGIADAVTVLAPLAARADAAATLIANAVDLPGHPAIRRVPASEIEAVPQLRDRLVTAEVGPLSMAETAAALDKGRDYAQGLAERGLIAGATLALNGEIRVIGSAGSVTGPRADPS